MLLEQTTSIKALLAVIFFQYCLNIIGKHFESSLTTRRIMASSTAANCISIHMRNKESQREHIELLSPFNVLRPYICSIRHI